MWLWPLQNQASCKKKKKCSKIIQTRFASRNMYILIYLPIPEKITSAVMTPFLFVYNVSQCHLSRGWRCPSHDTKPARFLRLTHCHRCSLIEKLFLKGYLCPLTLGPHLARCITQVIERRRLALGFFRMTSANPQMSVSTEQLGVTLLTALGLRVPPIRLVAGP